MFGGVVGMLLPSTPGACAEGIHLEATAALERTVFVSVLPGALSMVTSCSCKSLAACAALCVCDSTECTAVKYARDTSGYILPAGTDGRNATPSRTCRKRKR